MKKSLAGLVVLAAAVAAYFLWVGPQKSGAAGTPEKKNPPAKRSPDGHGVVISGKVRAKGGGPVTSGFLIFKRSNGVRRGALVHPDGSYRKRHVRPGDYKVVVLASGYKPYHGALTVPEGAKSVEKDVALVPSLRIPVRFVTPEGMDLSHALTEAARHGVGPGARMTLGMTAVATLKPPGARLPATSIKNYRAFGVGYYRRVAPVGPAAAKDDRDGTLEVDADLPVYVSACVRDVVLSTVKLDKPRKRLDLVVDPGKLAPLASGASLVVTTDDGTVPKRVYVDVSDIESGVGNVCEPDAKGRIAIHGYPPGVWQIAVRVDASHETYRKNVTLSAGRVVDLGAVRLGRSSQVAGTVIGPDGKPARHVRIDAYEVDRPWAEQRYSPEVIETDRKGRFTLQLGPHRYAVRARSHRWGVALVTVDNRKGEAGAVKIEITKGTPVTLGFSEEAALPMDLRIEGEGGLVYFGGLFEGGFTLAPKLPPGTYTLRATDAAGQVDLKTLTVGTEAAEPVVLK